MSATIFVGRQPILNRNGELFGYELLYRNSKDNTFPNVQPEQATIQLLIHTFLSIGIEKVAHDKISFINFSSELLTKDIFSTLCPSTIAIEILEDVEMTPALQTRMRELKEMGFLIVLDDFVLREPFVSNISIFETVDIVKVDFLNLTKQQRHEIEQFMQQFPHIQLLAEKIETNEEYEEAKKIGYELFQGYYFSRPEIIEGVDIPHMLHLHLQLIQKLNAETANLEEIDTLFKRDVSLTYKLLRYINSFVFGTSKKITSIKQAIVLIGIEETAKWLRLLALYEWGELSGKGQLQALISKSVVRGRMCELLAIYKKKSNPEEYFLLGMLSLLDLILKKRWPELKELMPLAEKTAATLAGEWTEMSPFLQLAVAAERLEMDHIEVYASNLNVPLEEISRFSHESNRWARMLDV